ncbi:CvpA family protein [Helicobacter burdigaliensis]|uniref:CvpA family protein n=1 Tax=Helicobacter burdigaliensis TaxID=2315334 RepID=UPI000EF71DAD|nr:CvpA family protein [Helicobacter burdigaliensis]
MSELSYFDIVVGIIIILLGLKGIVNGLIREFFGIVGIVGGVYIASLFSDDLGLWINQNVYEFANPSAASLVGFLVLLVCVWGLSLVVAEILHKLISFSSLVIVDKALGFVFAVLKIFAIFAIIVYALSKIELVSHFGEKYTKNSILYPTLLDVGSKIIHLESLDTSKVEEKIEATQEKTQEIKDEAQETVQSMFEE